MKKVILAIAIMIGISAASNAQTPSNQQKKDNQKMEMKDHVCTAACKDGKHVYAHGEKGHKCTKECKKKSSTNMEMKEHVCTDACKNGQHMYAHGEKGHVCTDSCPMHKQM